MSTIDMRTSDERRVFHLVSDSARRNALACVQSAPDGFVVRVDRPTRTAAQNRRYWGRGVLAQIAEKARVAGRKFSAEAWHEIAKRQFLGVVELPGGGLVGKSSTGLSTAEFSAFCDQVEAWAAVELGVVFEDLPPHD